MFDAREIATMVWVVVVVIGILVVDRDRRVASGLASAIRSLLHPKLLVPFVCYVGWLGACVFAARHVGLWNSGLVKPTVVWATFSGLALYFSFDKALKGKPFFRSALITAAGVTAVLEFLVNFRPFPLPVELAAQPVVALAAMVAVYARSKQDMHQVAGIADFVVATFGISALGWALWGLVHGWNDVDPGAALSEFFVPLWLTPPALGFVYLLAMYAGYEQAFLRIGWKASGRSSWRQKLAYVSVVRLRLAKLRRLSGRAQMEVADETSFGGARRALLAHERSDGLEATH